MQAKGTIENTREGGRECALLVTVAKKMEPHRRVHHFSGGGKFLFKKATDFTTKHRYDSRVHGTKTAPSPSANRPGL